MRLFPPVSILFLLVACGGDVETGLQATIVSPLSGDEVVEATPTLFEGMVTDDGKSLIRHNAVWKVNDRVACRWQDVELSGYTSCTISMRVDEDTITLEVEEPGLAGQLGRSAQTSVEVVLLPLPGTPQCEIKSPSDGGSSQPNQPTDLSVRITQLDEIADGVDVQWTSSLDGDLGGSAVDESGWSELSVQLSEGSHTLSMDFDGGQLGVCSDSVTFALGELPVVSITSPQSGTLVNQGEGIRLEGSGTFDSSGNGEAMWSSDLDGSLVSSSYVSGEVSGVTIYSLSAGVHTLKFTVIDSMGLSSSDTIDVTVNGVPSTPVVSIEPDPALSDDDLFVVLDSPGIDPEGSVVTHTYNWYVDDVLYGTDITTVPATDTEEGQEWRVTVSASDGVVTSSLGSSTLVVAGFSGWGLQSQSVGLADTIFAGEREDDSAGYALSSGCDFDGDGMDELLIGAPENDDYWSDGGKTYLVLGSEIAVGGLIDLYYMSHTFLGNTSTEESGSSLDCGGDLDGDGLPDILIGAPGWDLDRGAVYVILGADIGAPAENSLGDSHAVILGEETTGMVGSSLSFAGDVDGDGVDDVLIGAWANGEGGTFAGRSYLFHGSTLSKANVTHYAADADSIFTGASEGDRSGSSIAGVGDVDGDGLDDIVVGAYGHDADSLGGYVGAAHIFSGASISGQSSLTLSSSDYLLEGEEGGDYAGHSVGPAGDLDQDGLADIYVSSVEGGGVGVVYLVLGADLVLGTSSLTDASVAFIGEGSGDRAGTAVLAEADIDGDGNNDMVIGGNSVDGSASNSGRTYALLGDSWSLGSDVDLADADWYFDGEYADDNSGFSLAAGDFNGDGLDDFAIGAPSAGKTKGDNGEIYLLLAPQ